MVSGCGGLPRWANWLLRANITSGNAEKSDVAVLKTLQVLPVERGAGLSQPGMRAAEACLADGDWLHIFPEVDTALLH